MFNINKEKYDELEPSHTASELAIDQVQDEEPYFHGEQMLIPAT